ncbi:MAG TPA: acetyl-CoA C-acyltransferase [Planctomycetota bacterium]|nr:acetyl-CoA C-acyltransferase [Planctomycetota bacterium]
MSAPRAVIVSAARTPVTRAGRGRFARVRPDDLAVVALRAALERAPGFDPATAEDLILGCAFPEAEQGLNVARLVGLAAGLPDSVPGMVVNRFCASGLQSIAQASERIASGAAHAILAGGLESMTFVPMTGHVFRPNGALAGSQPDAYIGMGLTAERVAEQFKISRADQDAFALASHRKAVAATASGRFRDEIAPVAVRVARPAPQGGGLVVDEGIVAADDGPRPDTSLESLGRLAPVFRTGGTVTAGNSSQTSDGASVLLLLSEERARALGLAPMGTMLSYAVVGVPPGLMGIGPVHAVPAAVARAGLKLEQIELFELNEAFAAQALHCMRALGLPPERVNVNGGAIAMGHPLGATGSRLATTLLHELHRRRARYGVVTMCVGGGMGAAAVFEALPGWSPPAAPPAARTVPGA